MRLVAPALVFLFLLTPAIAAQETGADRILLQADLPADGRALVGHPAHFGFLLLSAEDRPIIHQDIHIELVQNGVVLFATEDAHDYDGVAGFDVVFSAPGPYRFTVTVPGKDLAASYQGEAFEMVDAIAATLRLEAPTTAEVGAPVTFTYANVDANDTLLPHTDVQVEVRRVADDFPVLQVHTHTHEDEQAFTYVFERPGQHTVRFVSYLAFPSKGAQQFVPFVTEHKIELTGQPLADSPLPMVARAPELPIPITSTEEARPAGLTTTVAADPASGTQDAVGPYSQVRATVAVRDTDSDVMLQHTDHSARLEGPHGLVFESDTLHEYDGVLTIMAANQIRGDYTWTMVSEYDGASATDTYTYMVGDTDPTRVRGTMKLFGDLGTQATGTTQQVGLYAGSDQSTPFPHSEVFVQILPEAGLPLFAGKLHTHATGEFSFQTAYDLAGPHTLQADLFGVHREDTPEYEGADGGPTRFAYEVTDQGPLPRPAPVVETVEEASAAGLTVLVLAALALLVANRRRA